MTKSYVANFSCLSLELNVVDVLKPIGHTYPLTPGTFCKKMRLFDIFVGAF